MWWRTSFGFTIICFQLLRSEAVYNRSFPEEFLFGTATSAYQIEGGWNADGKGVNSWDRMVHDNPHYIVDGSNGDVACDSYNKYLEDVANLKYLGVNFYRFSLSWARILPTGFANEINQNGIDYYNNLINALLENGIQPMITLYHWDLPILIYDLGGRDNTILGQYFRNYARVAFQNFGDRVKYWFTFNEPKQTCLKGFGYSENMVVSDTTGIAEYICSTNVLMGHASIYHMYNEEFKAIQNGKISIVLDGEWFEPESDSEEDVEAQYRKLSFTLGWFANAIYSTGGNYPTVMLERVANRSALEGFRRTRLKPLTDEEVDYVRGTCDFFALNSYSTSMAKYIADLEIDSSPSWNKDTSVESYKDDSWPKGVSDWLRIVPWGFRKLLVWIKENYNDPEILITENGFSDEGGVEDELRTNYYKEYLSALLEAIFEDDVKVIGYAAWSLMDNFEWFNGYTEKFGLFQVDFNDDNRTRTAKASAAYYKTVISSRCLLENATCVL